MKTDVTPEENLLTRTRLGLKEHKIPSATSNDYTRIAKLEVYRQHWESLRDLRDRYTRNSRFHRGGAGQWGDYVIDYNGERVKESDLILQQGKIPHSQNIIRPIVKALEGLYRSNIGKSIVVSRLPDSADIEKMLSNTLQYINHINENREINTRALDIMMLSGLPIQRISFDFDEELGRNEVLKNNIDPYTFFFNTDISDVRGKDLRIVGQLHDVTFDELIVGFSNSKQDTEHLSDIYGVRNTLEVVDSRNLTSKRRSNINFFIPQDPQKCRVIEVWEKRPDVVIEVWDELDGSQYIFEGSIDELNEQANQRYAKYERAGIDKKEVPQIKYQYKNVFRWYYQFLSPLGHVLREGKTPYKHNSHPYIFTPYPLINGEVWGLVEDIIDQQKQINRHHTLWDFIINTSAKNTLIVDEESLNGQSVDDIAEDYRRVGGVIVLRLKDGAKLPKEIKGSVPNLGIPEMIQMQMRLVHDISGVQPAMQGHTAGAGVPASRYLQESRNATINSRDIMESFNSMQRKADLKALKVAMQFYKEKRYLAISGDASGDERYYDPERAGGFIDNIDLVISESPDTPTYKSYVDDLLKELVMNKLIDMRQFLTHSNFPFSKSLLEDMQNREEQMQQSGIEQATSGDVPGANQEAVEQAMKMMRK